MTQQRLPDTVKVESEAGEFTNFTSLQITNDLMAPSEAGFEVGDDQTWTQLEQIIALGKPFRVFVNDTLHMTGRVELTDAPIDPGGGAVVRFTVRTKMADAMYASADPFVTVQSTSIRDFVLEAYSLLGYTAEDFVFDQDTARDLLTGKLSDGSDTPTDLEPLKVDQAKINPPETIHAAVTRHLMRHGLMHWDSPDGRIVVGAPNDFQDPIYRLRMRIGSEGRENNILTATRTRDASGVPTKVVIMGSGPKNWLKAKIRGFAFNADLQEAGFYRPVVLVNEQCKQDDLAQRMAYRMLTDRSKRFDAWVVNVDGLSYWNGSSRLIYGIDTVADVQSDVAGGPAGAYLVHRVVKRVDAAGAQGTELSLLHRGLWAL